MESETIQHVLTQRTSIYSAHHVLPGIALNHFDSEEKKKGKKIFKLFPIQW